MSAPRNKRSRHPEGLSLPKNPWGLNRGKVIFKEIRQHAISFGSGKERFFAKSHKQVLSGHRRGERSLWRRVDKRKI